MTNKVLLAEISNSKEKISNETERFNKRLSEMTGKIDTTSADTSNNTLTMTDFSQWYSTVSDRISARNVGDAINSEISFTQSRQRTLKSHNKDISMYLIDVYKKYSLAIGAVIFAVLGVPLGLIARNGSAAISVSYSLVFFIFYWAFLLGGEHFAKQEKVIPSIAMWSGDAILTIAAIVLLRKVSGYESKINFAKAFQVIFSPIGKFLRFIQVGIVWRTIKAVFYFIADLPRRILKIFLPIIPAYLIGRFFSYFFVTTIGICVLTVIIDFVGNIHVFTGAKPDELAIYYLYFIASFLSMLLPISMLLSVMLSIGSFAKTNELTSIKSGGISMVKMTFPLILIGFFLSVGNFFFNETFLGIANQKLELYRNTFSARREGRPIPTEVVESRQNFYYFSDDFTAYFFKKIGTTPPIGETVVRYSFENYRVKSITTADSIEYFANENRWIMSNGTEKVFSNNGDISFNNLSSYTLTDLTQPPVDMIKTIRKVEQMSWNELQKRMESAKLRGEKIERYLADSNFKFSLPLMNVVVVLIGVAVTARSTKRGGAVHFGAGLGFVFLYWGIAQFLIVLGRNESVNPIVAAWSATVLFIIIGFILYSRASK